MLWSSNPPELQLNVVNINFVGNPPAPNNYDLTDGPPAFYDLNKITSITGNLVTIDNETYLQKEGGEQRIRINVASEFNL